MAVSRRLRFEIFRRDDFTCQYCGCKPPTVELEVDHVIPRTLGGSDAPENLTTACFPCNRGKASIPADAPIVADVAVSARLWRFVMDLALIDIATDEDVLQTYFSEFDDLWREWSPEAPRPANWRASVERWLDIGWRVDGMIGPIRRSMEALHVKPRDKWRYFCGVMWKTTTSVMPEAAEMAKNENFIWMAENR